MSKNLQLYLVSPHASVRQAIEVINKNKHGIALVVGSSRKLVGTITDGDVRRFMLASHSLDEPCSNLMWNKPVTAFYGTSPKDLIALMNSRMIQSLPLLGDDNTVVDLVHLRELISQKEKNISAVIAAGGEGKRLRPLTRHVPKPMMQVGDRPILETIILNLAEHGISNIYLTVHYQAQLIEDYFGNGSKHGVQINYIREEQKMGTAGGLSLIKSLAHEMLIVMNGDVVTNVNFMRILDFHQQHRAVMSVAAREYNAAVPYGVLNLAGHHVLGVTEKPSVQFMCNAGIYVINSELLQLIPSERIYNMTDLIHDVTRQGLPVVAFPLHEYWIDIGQKDDLKKARIDFQNEHYSSEKREAE